MYHTIAGIRLELPDTLIRGHFAEALRPFATANPGMEALTPAPETPTHPRPRAAALTPTPDTPTSPRSGAAGLTFEEADLRLRSVPKIPALSDYRKLHRFDFADADAECRFGSDAAGWLLEMVPRDGSAPARFRIASGTTQALTDITPAHNPALLRFGVWTLFNIAALRRGAVAIHASAIRFRDRGVLFLGESGTGKSTHTRLWREHIPGTVLLNDDSPVIRAAEGEARVYGSPWSGKTPCYRNESCPIAAVVRLSQAPHNRIRRLRPIEAIGALLPSAPPAFARDEELSDALCALLSRVIGQVPVYRLECRPDGDAARLACRTIFNDTAL